jgi:hypothetical protein
MSLFPTLAKHYTRLTCVLWKFPFWIMWMMQAAINSIQQRNRAIRRFNDNNKQSVCHHRQLEIISSCSLARTNYSSSLKLFKTAHYGTIFIVSSFECFQRRETVCHSKGMLGMIGFLVYVLTRSKQDWLMLKVRLRWLSFLQKLRQRHVAETTLIALAQHK